MTATRNLSLWYEHFVEHKSIRTLANAYGLSPTRVHEIVTREEAKLRNAPPTHPATPRINRMKGRLTRMAREVESMTREMASLDAALGSDRG